jgi:hypothetical protein
VAAYFTDNACVETNQTAANRILTPRETKAISRQRIYLFTRESLPQQLKNVAGRKLRIE